jgi:hypothetical protein
MNVICENCGEENSPGTSFCTSCGHYLGWHEPTTGEAAPVGSGSQRSARTPSPPSPPPPGGERPSRAAEPTRVIPPVTPPEAVREKPAMVRQRPCPQCNRLNEETRHFCAKCGYQLIGAPPILKPARPKAAWRRWWERLWDTRDRAARRAYRRSLPPLYRWRRVLIAVVVAALVVGATVVTKRQPLVWAQELWSNIFYAKRLVNVGISAVAIDPPNATVVGSNPEFLADNTTDGWAMTWTAEIAAQQCQASQTVFVILTFPARRIRQIVIVPGRQDEQERHTEFRPTAIRFAFGDGNPCNELEHEVADKFDELAVPADSGKSVDRLRIAVTRAVGPEGEQSKSQLTITEIRLIAREKY